MELSAAKRTALGHKVKQLRKEGKIPATVYGKKTNSQNVSVEEKVFAKVYAEAGDTKLINLTLVPAKAGIEGEKTLPVLIHAVQRHPVDGKVLHVEFLAVDLKQAVRVHVSLIAVGESPVVADKTGALLQPLSELEIECLPADLPEHVEVDISNLKAIGDNIHVKDIKISDKIKVLTDAEQVVFTISELVQKEKVEEVVTPTEVEATAEKAPEEGEQGAGEGKEEEKKVEAKTEEKKEGKK